MSRKHFLYIALFLILAIVIGSYVVAIGAFLFKLMLGIVALGLIVLGFYIGRWAKRS